MSIYKVKDNLPRLTQINTLNEMLLEVNGKVEKGIFNKKELDQIFTDLGMKRKYDYRNTIIGGTVATHVNWSHVSAKDGYSIWKFTPTSYAYNADNQLYFDNVLVENKLQATSETATTFDKVFLYNGDSGSGYTDNTTEAGTEGGTEFSIMDSTNDYLYLGEGSTFTGTKFEWQTRGSNYTLVLQYWNGSAWTTLTSNTNTLVDNTSNFESDGTITWVAPSDWATTSVNSQTKYWIRISTSTTPVTTAKGYYIIPGDSVIALLALSSSEIQDEDWKWCSYNSYVYVTIRNAGNTSYEGDYYITSSSSATNLENFFVHNHTFRGDYQSSGYSFTKYNIDNISNWVETKTSNYSIDDTDNIILADATGLQELRIDLPSARGLKGKKFTIKAVNIDSGTAGIIIDATSGETIDGVGTKSLTSDYSFVTLVSNDANWFIVAQATQVL